MKKHLIPFALVVTLLAPAVLAQDYEIHIVRPMKVGQEFKLSVTGKMTTDSSKAMGDAPAEADKEVISVQLDGVEKIVEVDEHSQETKVTVTVDKLSMTANGETKELAPKGTVITCFAQAKKTAYQIDGKDVDPDVAKALRMVVEVMSHDGPTNDEVFGTKERKKKGDSWDINADLAKNFFAGQTGMEVNDFSGKNSLEDVSADSMKLSAEIKGKIKPPLPPQITVDDSSLEIKTSGQFPLDTTKPETEDSMSVNFSFSAHADTPQGKLVIKVSADQSKEVTMTPLK
ncbi:MAG TPA: hypothetical protein VG733_14460 [Chthoniobacteraceae bacterium]|nr:hypothetical protein [Chthoniobacteraceae bacterium]